ncbi:FkbM family methyltransferase [Halostella litorea]|uniref:FkbM family methyltransferase n=1 Tax=Halostella litorea TaxID=2528831 RepID=UPI0010926BFE|nr:FkbM family methyltransferase [Halostella litorea]
MNLSQRIFQAVGGRGIGQYVPFSDQLSDILHRASVSSNAPAGQVYGNQLYIDPNDCSYTAKAISRGEIVNRGELEFYKSNIEPGMTIVDIGANIGYFTVVFASLVGNQGHVYAFEPVAESVDILNKNLSTNGHSNVTIEHAAVSDSGGETAIFGNENQRGHSSILSPVHENDEELGTVQTTTIDTYFTDTVVDFMKIDAEGAEPRIISGAEDCLESHQPKILMELNPTLWESDPEDTIEYLSDIGYSFQQLTDDGLNKITKKELYNLFDELDGNYNHTDIVLQPNS